METLLGHQKIQQYFQKMFDLGTLHHAYVFSGPEHSGKKTLAEHIAAYILGTTRAKLGIHPDFLLVERKDEDGNLKKDITVEHIALVTSKVMMTPISAKYNVIIIEDAERMNLFAANALLKTLEEPATPTIFFLLTHNIEQVLPTIRSRVHSIELPRIPLPVLEAEYIQHFPDHKQLAEMLPFSCGLPGLLREWQQTPELFEEYKAEMNRFFSLFSRPLFEKIAIVEPLFGDKKAHIEGRKDVVRVLHIWQEGVQAILSGSHLSPLHSPQLGSSIVVPIYDTIVEAISGLDKNIHPRLLVENILLTIP